MKKIGVSSQICDFYHNCTVVLFITLNVVYECVFIVINNTVESVI